MEKLRSFLPSRHRREQVVPRREGIVNELGYLTPFEAHKQAETVAEFITKREITVYSIGVTGGIGAGHAIQARNAHDFYKGLNMYEKMQIEARTFNLQMHEKDIIAQGYAWLQANPDAYKMFVQYGFNNAPSFVFDRVILGWAEPSVLTANMYGTGDELNPKQNRAFITTHPKATISVVQAVQSNMFHPDHTLLFEHIPDPWTPQEMLPMSSPLTIPNHYRVVHDLKSAHALLAAGRQPGKRLIPWGTLSNPFFLFNEVKKEPDGNIHVGIELSGNDIPGVTEKIKTALYGAKEQLVQDNIFLTIHTMHHPQAYREIKAVLEELGIADKETIRLIGGENIPMEEAIFTKEAYKAGRPLHDHPRFDIPNIYIAKGGEVPLEDRGQEAVVYAIWGEEHEARDIEDGVANGRAVDFRQKSPESIIVDAINDFTLKQVPKQRRQSHAHLAPLVHIFPDRYKNAA